MVAASMLSPSPLVGHTCRIITDEGAEFQVAVHSSSIEARYHFQGSPSLTIHLTGEIVAPSSFPVFAPVEPERQITIPDDNPTST